MLRVIDGPSDAGDWEDCPQCGYDSPADTKSCPFCGTDLTEADA